MGYVNWINANAQISCDSPSLPFLPYFLSSSWSQDLPCLCLPATIKQHLALERFCPGGVGRECRKSCACSHKPCLLLGVSQPLATLPENCGRVLPALAGGSPALSLWETEVGVTGQGWRETAGAGVQDGGMWVQKVVQCLHVNMLV